MKMNTVYESLKYIYIIYIYLVQPIQLIVNFILVLYNTQDVIDYQVKVVIIKSNIMVFSYGNMDINKPNSITDYLMIPS